MKTYRVIWEIDLEAVTPEAAAQEAFRVHRDPDSMATVFKVCEHQPDGLGEPVELDIEEIGRGKD